MFGRPAFVRFHLFFAFALAWVAALEGCNSFTETKPSLTGRWNGTSAGVDVELFLTHSGSQLSGPVGFYDTSNDALGSCEETGTYSNGSVTLVFNCGALGPSRYDGSTTDGTSMTGTLQFAGREYPSFTFVPER